MNASLEINLIRTASSVISSYTKASDKIQSIIWSQRVTIKM